MSQTTKIIIVIAVLALIGGIAWYVYSNKKEKESTPTTPSNGTSTSDKSKLQNILDLGGDIAKDASKSDLFA